MIIYPTKLTFERYKIKLPNELKPPMKQIVEAVLEDEKGTLVHEWGAKLFYFDRRKCIQIVNFASKLTLFLVDIKAADLQNLGDIIAHYLFKLYEGDEQMKKALERMFEESPVLCFEKLTDKSAIATLNHTQLGFAFDGYRFYDYIRDGILHTVEINRDVNFNWIFRIKTGGETEYVYAGEKFRSIILASYGSENEC